MSPRCWENYQISMSVTLGPYICIFGWKKDVGDLFAGIVKRVVGLWYFHSRSLQKQKLIQSIWNPILCWTLILVGWWTGSRRKEEEMEHSPRNTIWSCLPVWKYYRRIWLKVWIEEKLWFDNNPWLWMQNYPIMRCAVAPLPSFPQSASVFASHPPPVFSFLYLCIFTNLTILPFL